jgi:DNA helicase HerA-like ATPase
MRIGTTISSQERPNTHSFSFIAEKGAEIQKGMYIKAELPGERHAIGMISEIRSMNIYFSDVQDVSFVGNVADAYPVKEGESTVADVDIFGIVDREKRFRRSTISVSPGTEIRVADNELLGRFFGFNQGGMALGEIEAHGLGVSLNIERMFQKHAAVLAMSGAGKSYFTKVMLEELLSSADAPAVVVLDMHGEYVDFANDKAFGSRTERIGANGIRMGAADASMGIMRELYPDTSEAQEEKMEQVLGALHEKMAAEKAPQDEATLMGIIDAMSANETDKKSSGTYGVLKRRFGSLGRRGIIGKERHPDLVSKVKLGHMLVFDFSEMDDPRSAIVKGYYILKQLFELRRAGKIPPVVVFVEEAHSFAPEKAKEREGVSKTQVEKIAREGRKFGISICLITQRPAHLSQTALSQCNTHVFLRIANPNDLDFIKRGSENLTSSLMDMLPGLEVGEAVVVGEAVRSPLIFRVRKKKVADGKKTGLGDMISEWKGREKGRKNEFSEFL